MKELKPAARNGRFVRMQLNDYNYSRSDRLPQVLVARQNPAREGVGDALRRSYAIETTPLPCDMLRLLARMG